MRRASWMTVLLVAGALAAAAPAPAAVPVNFSETSAGGFFGCAVRATTGGLACWGYDNLGQTSWPLGSFRGLSSGLNHSCAIRTSDGTVACWGYDPSGQASPPGGGFASVSAGAYHTCGIRSADAAAACWGDDTFGESTPPAGSFTALASGALNSCAITAGDGTIACWGENPHGQNDAPAGSFSAIDAHGYTYCAIRSADGAVDCWGDSSYGQTSSEPAGSFSDVGVGQSHVCAVRSSDQQVVCWGLNGSGQSTPPPHAYLSVDGGENHTCAVRATDHRVDCWGDDFRGQLHAPPVAAGENSAWGRSTDTIVADGVSTATITIEARDQFAGNRRFSGGDVVTMQTTLGTLSPVTDNGDGTYTATLTAGTTSGRADLAAQVNGVPVTVPVVDAQNFVHLLEPGTLATATAPIDFGRVRRGATSGTRQVTVSNSGTTALTVTRVRALGFAASQYEVASSCTGAALEPGDQCTFDVRFEPTVRGRWRTQIEVRSVSSSVSVPVQGFATGCRAGLVRDGTRHRC